MINGFVRGAFRPTILAHQSINDEWFLPTVNYKIHKLFLIYHLIKHSIYHLTISN